MILLLLGKWDNWEMKFVSVDIAMEFSSFLFISLSTREWERRLKATKKKEKKIVLTTSKKKPP